MAKLVSDMTTASLPEAFRSVPVSGKRGFRRFLAFAGPAYLVSVGYMDPGNWATDLLGGSRYGYILLWVILASSLMAMVLQTLCARLGIASGRDLAQACRDYYPKPVSVALWILCEIAIIACDVAEVIGSAVALKLLFGLPLVWGVLITGLDVFALLMLMRFGFRKVEAIIVTLVGTIFLCFIVNLRLAQPDWGGVGHGLVTPILPDHEALFIAVGILGATVMPHNLYLHSSLVQTRQYEQTDAGKRQAIRFSTIDTLVALGGAFFVNAAILVLAAAVFYRSGTIVDSLEQAHVLLAPALSGVAATLFAVALLCSGQSSTVTATLAGQIVMEGFLNFRISPAVRRIITRGLAIIPALFIVAGPGSTKTVELIALTQVVLSMQLPFAIFPLVAFTASQKRMGNFASPLWLTILAFAIGIAITGLNVLLLWQTPVFGPGIVIAAALIIGGFALWLRLRRREPQIGTSTA